LLPPQSTGDTQFVSSANVQLVRDAFDAFLRGDQTGWLELAAPDIVITQFPDQPDVRDYHGREGLLEVMTAWVGTWDDYSIELVRAWDIGGLVFITAVQRGRGKGSGVPMEGEVTSVFTICEGAIARWRMFHSEQEALDAAKVDE
jgi:ketosteroid isomerase-like protein